MQSLAKSTMVKKLLMWLSIFLIFGFGSTVNAGGSYFSVNLGYSNSGYGYKHGYRHGYKQRYKHGYGYKNTYRYRYKPYYRYGYKPSYPNYRYGYYGYPVVINGYGAATAYNDYQYRKKYYREYQYLNDITYSKKYDAPKRRLYRDRDGNCFELHTNSIGDELRIELDPSECDW